MAENNQGVINALKESQKEGAKVIKDELKDAISPLTSEIKAPFQAMVAGINSLPGVGITKKLFSAVSKPLKDSFNADKNTSAKEVEANNAAARDAEQEKVLFEDIRDGIFAMRDGLLGMLKTAVDNPIAGILAGIGLAAFAMISSFFAQLTKEVKFLDKLMKGGLSKAFSPISKFFDSLGGKFKATKLGKTIDAFLDTVKNLFKVSDVKGFKGLAVFEDLQKTFGSATRPIIKIVDGIKDFGKNVKNIFSTIKTGLSSMKGFMAGFEPIMKFAKTIGSTLGKIFLPITFLMTIFDFVTGFMDGYDEGGVLGGLEGGITKVFQGIIGMPLDLLKKGVGYILGFFGFDNAKAALDKFSFSDLIGDLIGSIFDG